MAVAPVRESDSISGDYFLFAREHAFHHNHFLPNSHYTQQLYKILFHNSSTSLTRSPDYHSLPPIGHLPPALSPIRLRRVPSREPHSITNAHVNTPLTPSLVSTCGCIQYVWHCSWWNLYKYTIPKHLLRSCSIFLALSIKQLLCFFFFLYIYVSYFFHISLSKKPPQCLPQPSN